MKQEDFQLIEKYLEGELDGQALTDFHERMEKDAEFAEAVGMEKDILGGIELLGNEALKKQLEKIGEEEMGGAKVIDINNRRRKFLWAAAAVLGLALVAKFAIDTSPPSPEKLYAEYAVHEFDFLEKGDDQKILGEAIRKMEDGNFKDALPIMKSLSEEKPKEQVYLLALGICYLETNDLTEALNIFDNINSPLFEWEVIWYKALLNLKLKNYEQSVQLLTNIPSDSSRKKDADNLKLEILKIK